MADTVVFLPGALHLKYLPAIGKGYDFRGFKRIRKAVSCGGYMRDKYRKENQNESDEADLIFKYRRYNNLALFGLFF
jgi:hypothetical protein